MHDLPPLPFAVAPPRTDEADLPAWLRDDLEIDRVLDALKLWEIANATA